MESCVQLKINLFFITIKSYLSVVGSGPILQPRKSSPRRYLWYILLLLLLFTGDYYPHYITLLLIIAAPWLTWWMLFSLWNTDPPATLSDGRKTRHLPKVDCEDCGTGESPQKVWAFCCTDIGAPHSRCWNHPFLKNFWSEFSGSFLS